MFRRNPVERRKTNRQGDGRGGCAQGAAQNRHQYSDPQDRREQRQISTKTVKPASISGKSQRSPHHILRAIAEAARAAPTRRGPSSGSDPARPAIHNADHTVHGTGDRPETNMKPFLRGVVRTTWLLNLS